jgi:predicted RNase H-like nuclease
VNKEQKIKEIKNLKQKLAKLEESVNIEGTLNSKLEDNNKITEEINVDYSSVNNPHYRLDDDGLDRMLTDYVSKYWKEHPNKDMTKCYFVIDSTGKIEKHKCGKNANMETVKDEPIISRGHKKKHWYD